MNNATVRQCKVCGLVKPVASVRRSRGGGHICLRCAAERRRASHANREEELPEAPAPALEAAATPASVSESAAALSKVPTAPTEPTEPTAASPASDEPLGRASKASTTGRTGSRRKRRRHSRTQRGQGRYTGHWATALRDLAALVLVVLAFFGLWLWVTSRL